MQGYAPTLHLRSYGDIHSKLHPTETNPLTTLPGDLKLMLTGWRRVEHLSLCSQQHIVGTVEDSVLRTKMTGLESQEEDVPNRVL